MGKIVAGPRFECLQDPLKPPGTILSFRDDFGRLGRYLHHGYLGIVIGHFTLRVCSGIIDRLGSARHETTAEQSMTDRVLDVHVAGIDF
jgi:hypothetical protein